MKKIKPKQKFYEAFILRSWWVLLALGGGYLLYVQGIQKKEATLQELAKKLYDLEEERGKALEEREDLLLQINSQSDPEWIQMTLMKGLGVVPEGQVKVYFKKEE